ncbi:MAG: phosphoribosyltransferase [archaeon]
MQKDYLSWNQFSDCVAKLIVLIKKDNLKYDGVYGIPRGGLPLAVTMSHALGLPLLAHPTENTLVVDDISDTGNALNGIKRKKIACIYTTPWTITKPDYFILTKESKDHWIIFPWEGENEGNQQTA